MPDQPRDLLDALRFRIADPGAYLPRRFDPDGEPTETVAFWAARAVAAGLADGALGYVPTAQQLDPDEHQTVVDFLKAYIRLCGSRLPDDHRIHAILAKLTAPAPVPGSSQRAQEQTNADLMLESAWGVIANVGNPLGDWDSMPQQWREAAVEWARGYHAWLDERVDGRDRPGGDKHRADTRTTRALQVYEDLAAANPGDMFAFDQAPGQRVAVVVAAFGCVTGPVLVGDGSGVALPPYDPDAPARVFLGEPACTHQAGCPVHGDVRDCEPLPHAGESQASEPADRLAAPKLAQGAADAETARVAAQIAALNPFACNRRACFCGGRHD